MFTLDHDPVDGSHLIVAGGELDLAATSEMSAIFAMSAAGPQDAVVLDLVGVEFIDSSALGTILRAAQQLEASGKRMHVVAPEGPVRRLLEITGAQIAAVTLEALGELHRAWIVRAAQLVADRRGQSLRRCRYSARGRGGRRQCGRTRRQGRHP